MLLGEHMLRAVGANALPRCVGSQEDRDAVQKYLDTCISAGWGRTLHSATIYVVLMSSEERDRSVSKALVSTGKKEIERFARSLADRLEAEIARFDAS